MKSNKTIMEVIEETRAKINKKEIKNPKGKFYYIKKNYGNCISLLRKDGSSNLYISCLSDLYGPFRSTKQTQEFKELLRTNQEAHQQAMWNSWKSDPVIS